MRVLVTPLNWGIGHAARCIPVINELMRQGAEVIIASDGAALQLLKKEYPLLPCFELPAWNITYPENGSFPKHLFMQSFKIVRSILAEKRAMEEIVRSEKIDLVISDNRLGCYSGEKPSVIMTHQVFIETPFLRRTVNLVNHRYFRKFSELWIVDLPQPHHLSGQLSARYEITLPHRYLGIISRFKPNAAANEHLDIVVLISGLEPQRTLLEKELLPQLAGSGLKGVVLLGKPGGSSVPVKQGGLTIYDHLPGEQIEALLHSARAVISRTGYTTLMDLVLLRKKGILIPTPGQTEQEYLGAEMKKKGWFVIQEQGKTDLLSGLKELDRCMLPQFNQTDYLAEAVTSLLNRAR